MNALRLEIVRRYRTQERFSVCAGLDESIISKIIRGVKRPTEQQRQIFARLLETPAEKLFGEDHERHN